MSRAPENTALQHERALRTRLVKLGAPSNLFGDLYHSLLRSSWVTFIALITLTYTAVNVAFAALYLLGGNCIENARPGSFEDAFFFSVQTLATIGYGKMSPRGSVGHAIMTVEALTGIIGVAIITGLIFAKFSRPTARVVRTR